MTVSQTIIFSKILKKLYLNIFLEVEQFSSMMEDVGAFLKMTLTKILTRESLLP
jgi:hypothetical protein